MQCSDCVHYEVCGKCAVEGMDYDQFLFESRCPRVDFDCHNFKPKSRFVELPCEVGQTVYSLMGGFAEEMKVNRFLLILNPNEQHPLDYGKKIDDFGKTVFLTKEEAENALAERSK